MSELDRVESSRCSWPVMSLPMCGRVALQGLILKIEPGLVGWRWILTVFMYTLSPAKPIGKSKGASLTHFVTQCERIPSTQAEVVLKEPGDYSTPNGIRILTPDIVIEDRGQTIAVVG